MQQNPWLARGPLALRHGNRVERPIRRRTRQPPRTVPSGALLINIQGLSVFAARIAADRAIHAAFLSPARHLRSAVSQASSACRSGTHARPVFPSDEIASGITTSTGAAGWRAHGPAPGRDPQVQAVLRASQKPVPSRHGRKTATSSRTPVAHVVGNALLVSSAPARRDTKLAIMDTFRNSELLELYGSTEQGWATLLRPSEQLTKLGSVGREFTGSGRIKLRDETKSPKAGSASCIRERLGASRDTGICRTRLPGHLPATNDQNHSRSSPNMTCRAQRQAKFCIAYSGAASDECRNQPALL